MTSLAFEIFFIIFIDCLANNQLLLENTINQLLKENIFCLISIRSYCYTSPKKKLSDCLGDSKKGWKLINSIISGNSSYKASITLVDDDILDSN